MRTPILYSILIGELILSLIMASVFCIKGSGTVLEVAAVLLLIIPIAVTVILIKKANSAFSVIFATILGITHLFLNRYTLGVIFGWEICPMI